MLGTPKQLRKVRGAKLKCRQGADNNNTHTGTRQQDNKPHAQWRAAGRTASGSVECGTTVAAMVVAASVSPDGAP